MRKFLLFGTMLGVASAALAFGGMFNHGNKSTTYKGGLNAIGVHFGGKEKADIKTTCPEHSTWNGTSCECNLGWTANESGACECPEERKCGDTCCGVNNVCVDGNKCCYVEYQSYFEHGWRESIDSMCCDVNESLGYAMEVDANRCCAMGEIPYMKQIGTNYSDDKAGCCDGVVLRAENSEYQSCCPKGSTYVNEYGECCGGDTVLFSGDEEHCCPKGSTGWAGECCEAGTVPLVSRYGDSKCCPAGSTGFSGAYDQCCAADEKLMENEVCCPEDSTGFDAYEWKCCEPGTKLVPDEHEEMHCCPDNTTSWANGECI